MFFSFSSTLAQKMGVNASILLQGLSVERGYIFSHSLQKLHQMFPFWTVKQLRVILKKLIKEGIITPVFDEFASIKKTQAFKINTDLISGGEYLSCTNSIPFMPKWARTDLKLNKPKSVLFDQKGMNGTINALLVILESVRFDQKGMNGRFTEQLKEYLNFTNDKKGMNCITLMLKLFILLAGHEMNATVLKVYMNIFTEIVIIFNIIKIIVFHEKEKEHNNCLKFNHRAGKSMRKIPASPEHLFNSKLVLAELNNLVVPSCRANPFKPIGINLGSIIEQLKNGASVEDCIRVVKIKFQQWHNVPSMHSALQPSTIFGKRFQNYLGEKLQGKNGDEKNKGFNGSIDSNSTASSRAAENLSCFSDALDRARERYGNGS